MAQNSRYLGHLAYYSTPPYSARNDRHSTVMAGLFGPSRSLVEAVRSGGVDPR